MQTRGWPQTSSADYFTVKTADEPSIGQMVLSKYVLQNRSLRPKSDNNQLVMGATSSSELSFEFLVLQRA